MDAIKYIDIELSTLDYIHLTEEIKLLSFDLNDITQTNMADIDYLDCLPARHIENTVCVTALQTDTVTAVVYWFELLLADDVSVCTRDIGLHFTQSAILFYDEILLTEGTKYQLRTVCDHSYLNISISES